MIKITDQETKYVNKILPVADHISEIFETNKFTFGEAIVCLFNIIIFSYIKSGDTKTAKKIEGFLIENFTGSAFNGVVK